MNCELCGVPATITKHGVRVCNDCLKDAEEFTEMIKRLREQCRKNPELFI